MLLSLPRPSCMRDLLTNGSEAMLQDICIIPDLVYCRHHAPESLDLLGGICRALYQHWEAGGDWTAGRQVSCIRGHTGGRLSHMEAL